MGLDIYFLKKLQPVLLSTDMPEQTIPSAEPEKIGYYRKFNALLNWVDTQVAEVDNCVDVPLSRSHLETLWETLSQLTTENCHDVFPTLDGFYYGSQTYDESYWSEVDDLKQFVQSQLDAFDFKHHQLCFYAWW